MANRTWLGVDTPGDWSVAANWSPAVVPIDGDDVFLTGTSTQAVTAGLDQSLIQLASLTISEGYTQNIGSSGNNLIIDATTLRYDGRGAEAYLEGDYPTVIAAGSGDQADSLHLKGIGTDIDDLRITGGRVKLLDSSTAQNIYMAHHGNISSDVVLNIGSSCTVTAVYKTGGILTSNSAIVTAYHSAGIWTHKTGALTTVWLFGGVLFWEASATATTVHVFGGTFDATKDIAGPRTITTLNVHPGGTAKLPVSGVTVTNQNNYGGTIQQLFSEL